MTVYEMRTYTLHVGKMGEAVKLYSELGYPALQKGGQDKKLIGYFQADTGMINQLVHLWKFDDNGRRVGAELCIVQWQKGRPVAVHPESIAVSKAIWPKLS